MLPNTLHSRQQRIEFNPSSFLDVLQHRCFERAQLARDGVAVFRLLRDRDADVLANGFGLQHDPRHEAAHQIVVQQQVDAARGDGLAMLKWISSFPGNPERGLPTVMGVVVLSDAETSAPVALVDAKAVTAAALKGRGNVKLGQKLFTQQGCVACHAVDLAAEPELALRRAWQRAASSVRWSMRSRPQGGLSCTFSQGRDAGWSAIACIGLSSSTESTRASAFRASTKDSDWPSGTRTAKPLRALL